VQKWEYKVVDLIKEIKKENKDRKMMGHWVRTPDLEKILNRLGAQNWELVDIQFLFEKEEPILVGFFKRHK